jgi:amino acid transporter
MTTRDRDTDEGRFVRDRESTVTGRETVRARQREEFGGTNWGAAFFGFLVAVGIAAILLGLLGAAGAVFQLNEVSDAQANRNADTIGLVGGILLVAVVTLAYWFGGYTSGRMSRFDGGRQGLGTWVIGLLVTIALALAAVVLGDQYNVLEQLNLPSLPVGEQTLATGGIIALAAIVLGTLLAAMFGGKVGERYHKRIDRAGFVD